MLSDTPLRSMTYPLLSPSGFPCVQEKTFARSASMTGVGFVYGQEITLRFVPAPAGTGLAFVRTDLAGQPKIPARWTHLLHNNRRTAIGVGDAVVEMTEHILAPLYAAGITSAYLEIDGNEAPAGDGSSRDFQELLEQAGTALLPATVEPVIVRDPITLQDGSASIEIGPHERAGLSVEYHLEYNHPGIGVQSHHEFVTADSFQQQLASARTFVLEQEVAQLRSLGIGLRQSARDLLVFAGDGSLIDNELRFPNECARHKLLDVVGDLALLGRPLWGRVTARRSGHRHNVELVSKLEQVPRKAVGEAA